MKVCGYCNNEYDDIESKCPVCGSTLLKYDRHSDSAEAELKEIKDTINRKRKTRSLIIGIGAAAILLAIVVAILGITGYVTDPQRDIEKEAKELFTQAEQQVNSADYDAAISTIDKINPDWKGYAKAENLRLKAVKGQLTARAAEYEAVGNYEALISFIKANVSDIGADEEIEAIYENAVRGYVINVLKKVDEYANGTDYSSALSTLNTATALIGDNVDISTKKTEIENLEIRSTIQSYENNGDYISLVSYLQGIVARDSGYSALLEQYEQALINQTLAAAQSYADERQFSDAIRTIEDAQHTYDCSEFSSAIEEYSQFLPTRLVDCYIVQKKTYMNIERSGIDSFGKKREDSLVLRPGLSNPDSIVYNLSGKFASFSGEMIHLEGGFYDASVEIKIYLDDTLSFSSGNIDLTTQAQAFTVDVSGCTLLRIECSTTSYCMWGGGVIIDALLS